MLVTRLFQDTQEPIYLLSILMAGPAEEAIEVSRSWDPSAHLAFENLEWQPAVPEHLSDDPVPIHREPLATDADDCPADSGLVDVGEDVVEEFWDSQDPKGRLLVGMSKRGYHGLCLLEREVEEREKKKETNAKARTNSSNGPHHSKRVRFPEQSIKNVVTLATVGRKVGEMCFMGLNACETDSYSN